MSNIDFSKLSDSELEVLFLKVKNEKKARTYHKDAVDIKRKLMDHPIMQDMCCEEKIPAEWYYDSNDPVAGKQPLNIDYVYRAIDSLGTAFYKICDYANGNYVMKECKKRFFEANAPKEEIVIKVPTIKGVMRMSKNQFNNYKDMMDELYKIFDKYYKKSKEVVNENT